MTEETTLDEAPETDGVFRGRRPTGGFHPLRMVPHLLAVAWLTPAHRRSFLMFEAEDDHDVLDPRL